MSGKIILIVFLFFVLVAVCFAQEKEDRTIGLAAIFQESQLDINLPFWMAKKVVLSPAIGFTYVQGDAGGFDLVTGMALKYYPRLARVSPYMGIRGGVFTFFPGDQEDSETDYLAGLFFGGELFLTHQFSFGVEAQVNASFSGPGSLRFGNPDGMTVNTATAVFASVYF